MTKTLNHPIETATQEEVEQFIREAKAMRAEALNGLFRRALARLTAQPEPLKPRTAAA